MGRTAIPVQSIPAFGGALEDVSWTAADAANDHEFVNNGRTLLAILNTGAAPKTVTVVGVANIRTFNVAPSLDVDTTNAKQSYVGPFPMDAFNQSDGKMHVDLADDTGLAFAAVSLTPTP